MPRVTLRLQPEGGPFANTGQHGRATQEDGSFEFAGVAPGEYALSADRFGGEIREFA